MHTLKQVVRTGCLAVFFAFLVDSSPLYSQENTLNPELLKGFWPAKWISCPGVPARAYGVYHFRKTFQLTERPAHFFIHVTADNRYRLFINGRPIGNGPARGDLYNWNFETYDIAPYLVKGKNCLAALVWNMGVYAPVAQISNQTGFLVQGDLSGQQQLNTNGSWKVLHDTAYTPCALDMGEQLHTYMVVGPGDAVSEKNYPAGWEKTGYDDTGWQQAVIVNAGAVPFGYGSDNVWTLSPSTIPQMEDSLQRICKIRRSEHIFLTDSFNNPNHPLVIPANQTVSILLDQTFETTAYPVLTVAKGSGASIKLTYAESLVDSSGEKGNRDSIQGKTIRGLYDLFYPDGSDHQSFRPLWFRTYRYIQLDITTGKEALVLEDFYGRYTGYPFVQKASFHADDSSLEKIWETGWRTARLCAGETYFDCPYYEELQYEADTRIQSLISLYNTGDDRLMRKAIHDFYDSRVPSGLTQGRYPSNRLQVIPPFSLFWISMLHDYWMLRDDPAFIRQYLPAATLILDWYHQHVDNRRQMLGPMNWWSFTDWNADFPDGVPPGANDGNSAVITLQYVYTLRQAAELFDFFGRNREAENYRQEAGILAAGCYKNCFDHTKMEMADTPEKTTFSQHTSIWAVLSAAIPVSDEKSVMYRVLADSTLSQATFYFRFYLTRALVRAGLGDRYYSSLSPWRDMLKTGLTTFAEKPEPTRSDCHGWSASPNYDFLATICGITPSKPGFREVAITPHLGTLKHVQGSMPCPQGMIEVELSRTGLRGIKAIVVLPEKLSGTFTWQGTTLFLQPGRHLIDLK